MSFLAPWFLLLLLPVLVLASVAVVLRRRRDRYAVRFASLPLLERVVPERPAWRRHVTGAMALLALGLSATAAARPEVDVRVPHERATVIVAIDTSSSMQARDIAPDRMRAAREAARQFVRDLPEEVNVGLVSFASSATVLAPPSSDHATVERSLEGVQLANSTAIGEAVFTSLDQLVDLAGTEESDGASPPARIVLLSDGSNTAGRTPQEAAAAATAAGVPVSTIAYGTADGVIDGGDGRQISVPVDERTLSDLATATGGTAYTAASGDELRAVYDDIGSSIGWRTEARELTPYLAATAFLFLLTAAALSLRWFARLV